MMTPIAGLTQHVKQAMKQVQQVQPRPQVQYFSRVERESKAPSLNDLEILGSAADNALFVYVQVSQWIMHLPYLNHHKP